MKGIISGGLTNRSPAAEGNANHPSIQPSLCPSFFPGVDLKFIGSAFNTDKKEAKQSVTRKLIREKTFSDFGMLKPDIVKRPTDKPIIWAFSQSPIMSGSFFENTSSFFSAFSFFSSSICDIKEAAGSLLNLSIYLGTYWLSSLSTSLPKKNGRHLSNNGLLRTKLSSFKRKVNWPSDGLLLFFSSRLLYLVIVLLLSILLLAGLKKI